MSNVIGKGLQTQRLSQDLSLAAASWAELKRKPPKPCFQSIFNGAAATLFSAPREPHTLESWGYALNKISLGSSVVIRDSSLAVFETRHLGLLRVQRPKY